MFREILEYLLDEVPLILRDDKFFQEFKDRLLDEVNDKEVILLSKIGVRDDLFQGLVDDIRKYCYSLDNEIILNLDYKVHDTSYNLGIREDRDNMGVFYEVEDDNILKRIILVKHVSFSRLENLVVKSKQGYYDECSIDVTYYTPEYEVIKNIDTEEIKDEIFSLEFMISKSLARFFRLNFKKYSRQISNISAVNKMEARDRALSEEQIFLFRKPFKLEAFKEFLIDELLNETKELEYSLSRKELVLEFQGLDIINNVISNLIQMIGCDGEVIMSDNLYQNLVGLLMKLDAEVLSTNGFIVKKNQVGYILYYVYLALDEVRVIPKEITEREAHEIFLRSPLNEKVEGLKEFLGSSRNR